MTKKSLILVVFTLLFICLSFLYEKNNHEQLEYISKLMEDDDSKITVRMDGVEYQVVSGKISTSGISLSKNKQVKILQTALALKNLSYRPIYGLPGTDLNAYKNAVKKLKITQNELASLQENELEKFLVKNGLYPIVYLDSLANTEKKRREFLRTGDRDVLLDYLRELEYTNKMYSLNYWKFFLSFYLVVPETKFSYLTDEYLINYDNSFKTFKSIKAAHDNAAKTVSLLTACFMSDATKCGTLEENVTQKQASIATAKETALTNFEEINKLMLAVYTKSRDVTEQNLLREYEIKDSTCVSDRAPVSFVITNSKTSTSVIPISHLRFVKVEDQKDVPFYQFLFHHGLRYAPLNQISHYNCPRFYRDIGSVYLLRELEELAEEINQEESLDNPAMLVLMNDIKNGLKKNKISDDLITELTMLTDKLQLSGKMEMLINDWKINAADHNSSLEKVVLQVADTEMINLWALKENGLPVNLSAEHLFFSRSGFVSFSLMASGIEVEPQSLYDTPINDEDSPYFYLEDIFASGISVEEVAADLKKYYDLHYDFEQ